MHPEAHTGAVLKLLEHTEKLRCRRVSFRSEHAYQALLRCSRQASEFRIADRSLDHLADQIARHGGFIVQQRANSSVEQAACESWLPTDAVSDDGLPWS